MCWKGSQFSTDLSPYCMRVVPPWTSASNRWPGALCDDTFTSILLTHGSGSPRAAYRCPTESGTRVCARGGWAAAAFDCNEDTSLPPFNSCVLLLCKHSLSLSLFARLTYPDFLLGRWPDSRWQSKVESVDLGPRVTEAVWNHPLFLQQYASGIFIARAWCCVIVGHNYKGTKRLQYVFSFIFSLLHRYKNIYSQFPFLKHTMLLLRSIHGHSIDSVICFTVTWEGGDGDRVSRVICLRRLLRKGHAKCTSGLVHCSGFSGLPRNSASSMCWTRLDAPFLFLS